MDLAENIVNGFDNKIPNPLAKFRVELIRGKLETLYFDHLIRKTAENRAYALEEMHSVRSSDKIEGDKTIIVVDASAYYGYAPGQKQTLNYGQLPAKKNFETAFNHSCSGKTFSFENDELIGTCMLTCDELWSSIKIAWRIADDGHLKWMADVLKQLDIEWI